MFRSVATLLTIVLAATTALARDESFPACDRPDGKPAKHLTPHATTDSQFVVGKALPWAPGFHGGSKGVSSKRSNKFVTSDPVFYTSPGTSSCGANYTDKDVVACLKPGWINSANKNGCTKWIEATLPSLGTRVTAQVIDACGALPDSETTFDCGDVYLSLAAYSTLARGDQSIIDAGRLPGNVTWSFVKEPCWACEGGLPGKLPNGDEDTCRGKDSWGEQRSGRKSGAGKKTGAEAGMACASKNPKSSLNMQQFVVAQDKQQAALAAQQQ